MEANIDGKKSQHLNERLDIILQEMTNFKKTLTKLEENSEHSYSKLTKLETDNKKEHEKMFGNINYLDNVITKFESIIKRIDSKIDSLDSRLTQLDSDNKKEHNKIFENLDRIDRRITNLKSENKEEHITMTKHLNSINSAFIRYETDGIDKIRILFDSDVDRKNHQDIYGHEFKYLHDLVAQNSFRISNLEKNSKK